MEFIIQHKSNKSTSKSTQNGAWFPEWNPRVILACIEGAFVVFALNLRMHSFHPCHYSFHPFNTNQGEIVLWRTLFRFVALSRFVRFRFFPLFVWRMQGINFQRQHKQIQQKHFEKALKMVRGFRSGTLVSFQWTSGCLCWNCVEFLDALLASLKLLGPSTFSRKQKE